MDVVPLFRVLVDPQSPPLEVLRGMVSRYGAEWTTWPYSAIKSTLEDELLPAVRVTGVDGIPEWAVQRACAVGAVALQDLFWTEWEHFHFLTQALNGDVADHANHRELSVGQMMLAVNAAESARRELGHLSVVPAFDDEVARYVAAQALNQGVWYLPPPLDFAAKYAAGTRYVCSDCGEDQEHVHDDHICDHCTHRHDTSQLGAWTPDPDVLAAGIGANIHVYQRNPSLPVAEQVELHLAHPDRAFLQTADAACAAKVLAALDYARIPRQAAQ